MDVPLMELSSEAALSGCWSVGCDLIMDSPRTACYDGGGELMRYSTLVKLARQCKLPFSLLEKVMLTLPIGITGRFAQLILS